MKQLNNKQRLGFAAFLMFALAFNISNVDFSQFGVESSDMASEFAGSKKHQNRKPGKKRGKFTNVTSISIDKEMPQQCQSDTITLQDENGHDYDTKIQVCAAVGENKGKPGNGPLSILFGKKKDPKIKNCSELSDEIPKDKKQSPQDECVERNARIFVRIDKGETECDTCGETYFQEAKIGTNGFEDLEVALSKATEYFIEDEEDRIADLAQEEELLIEQLQCKRAGNSTTRRTGKDRPRKRVYKKISSSNIEQMVECMQFISDSGHEDADKYMKRAYHKIASRLSRLVRKDPSAAQEHIDKLSTIGGFDVIDTAVESMETRIEKRNELRELALEIKNARNSDDRMNAVMRMRNETLQLADIRDSLNLNRSSYSGLLGTEYNEFNLLGNRYSDAFCSGLDLLKVSFQPNGCRDHGSLESVLSYANQNSIFSTRGSDSSLNPFNATDVRTAFLDRSGLETNLALPSNFFSINGSGTTKDTSTFRNNTGTRFQTSGARTARGARVLRVRQ